MHRQRHEGEAPDHAEGIQRSQQVHIAAAGNDGEDLQADDHIDDAITGAKPPLRFLEPGGQDAVFHQPVEHAVGADDGGIDRARQNERAHNHHEALEDQPQGVGADNIHGQAADQVGEVFVAHPIRE